MTPMLYIFSGLPGVGKTTLSKALAQRIAAVYLRVDTIEQSLRDQGVNVAAEGYYAAWRVAEDNLRLGKSVVADSCNPLPISRQGWQSVAISTQADYTNIEVFCSDISEHKLRVESRQTDISGLKLPTWDQVLNRDYEPWRGDRLVIDTYGQSIAQSQQALLHLLGIH